MDLLEKHITPETACAMLLDDETSILSFQYLLSLPQLPRNAFESIALTDTTGTHNIQLYSTVSMDDCQILEDHVYTESCKEKFVAIMDAFAYGKDIALSFLDVFMLFDLIVLSKDSEACLRRLHKEGRFLPLAENYFCLHDMDILQRRICRNESVTRMLFRCPHFTFIEFVMESLYYSLRYTNTNMHLLEYALSNPNIDLEKHKNKMREIIAYKNAPIRPFTSEAVLLSRAIRSYPHILYTCKGTLEDFALDSQIKKYSGRHNKCLSLRCNEHLTCIQCSLQHSFLCMDDIKVAFVNNFVFGKAGYGLDLKAFEVFLLRECFFAIYILVREMDIPQDIVGCITKTLLF